MTLEFSTILTDGSDIHSFPTTCVVKAHCRLEKAGMFRYLVMHHDTEQLLVYCNSFRIQYSTVFFCIKHMMQSYVTATVSQK